MSLFITPGAKSRITDFSTYVPKLATTIFGIVTTASKGDTDTRTLITTVGQLRSTFGPANANHKGLIAAIRYLRYGNQLYVVRVAGYSEQSATAEITDDSANVSVDVSAATTGTHGDNIDVVVSSGTEQGYKFQVYWEDVLYETYDNLLIGASNTSDEDYIDTRINGNSSLITVVDDSSYTTMSTGTYSLSGGNDGTDTTNSDIVGTLSGDTRTGLQLFANPTDLDLNLLAAPGMENSAVISSLATIAETRNDCMYLVSPPTGYTLSQSIAWHNGTGHGADDPSAALNDWRGAAYYPWLTVYNSDTDSNISIPPVGHVAGVMAYTDDVSYPWRAPAGPRRGLLKDVQSLAYNVTDGEHGQMCPVSGGAGQNNLNPIRSIPNEGIMVYSQKTLYRNSSSLRDVNVVRMLLYAMKAIATATRYLRWEPNDAVTWRQFEMIVNPELEAIKSTRGLYDFRVVCEEYMEQRSDLVNNDIMEGQLFMQPTRTTEVIVHDFTLLPYGAEFNV